MKKIAVIMAGGSGARLWPKSNEKNPKQFVHLSGEGTMLQNTVMRLIPFIEYDDIYIVTNDHYVDLVRDQIPAIPKENILGEPFPRNTAPCMALASTIVKEKYKEEEIVLVALPSDHVISNVREFHNALDMGFNLAKDKEAIVTIGVTPTRPETSYGYVQINDDAKGIEELYEKGVRFTSAFAEKPDEATAQRFIDSGDFLWNSGIFIWSMKTFWEQFEEYLPEQAKLFNMLRKHVGKEFYRGVLEDIYRQIQSVSIDYSIMENADNVYIIDSTFSWSDIGNWDEVFRLSMKDARNNALEGEVVSINNYNCLISSSGKMIGVVGCKDLIIINEDDSLLICNRGHSDDVKEVVDFLKRKQINRFL
jgi:mannose-1-phosphate guanylyltransferase